MSPTSALQKYCRNGRLWLLDVHVSLGNVICRSGIPKLGEDLNMEGNVFLTQDDAFKKLEAYFQEKGKNLNIDKLFQSDSERFLKYRYQYGILQLKFHCSHFSCKV